MSELNFSTHNSYSFCKSPPYTIAKSPPYTLAVRAKILQRLTFNVHSVHNHQPVLVSVCMDSVWRVFILFDIHDQQTSLASWHTRKSFYIFACLYFSFDTIYTFTARCITVISLYHWKCENDHM